MLISQFCNVLISQFSGMPEAYKTAGDADKSTTRESQKQDLVPKR